MREKTQHKSLTCFDSHKLFNVNCQRRNCKNWISCSSNYNCALIAAQNGHYTLQSISEMIGLTRMKICQLENQIIKKIQESL